MVPVVLIIFNRPHLTARVFEHIRVAKPPRLLVVADGPRQSQPDDVELCQAARRIATSLDWPCELLTNFSDTNLRCRRRISSGLDWAFEHCTEAIVLEDDCVPCSSFFDFCSHMLERYRDDARIMHVSGNNFQGGIRRGSGSYYFSRYSHTWGWASWRRAWRYYDVHLTSWPLALREAWLNHVLEDKLEIEYWTHIFEKTYAGQIDCWDYQWLFTCWCQGGLSILPNTNLVSNIGVGPDATNFKQAHSTIGIPARELEDCRHPVAIVRDREADRLTFEEHIAGRQMREARKWHRIMRNRLAVRTQIKRMLRAPFTGSA
jgi:hypothetical protein